MNPAGAFFYLLGLLKEPYRSLVLPNGINIQDEG